MSVKDIPDKLVCKAIHICHEANTKAFEAAPGRIWGMGPPDKTPWPYELLAQWTGQPEKVCYRAMERAEENGLLEYGVSLRTAWLTDKGKALLGI